MAGTEVYGPGLAEKLRLLDTERLIAAPFADRVAAARRGRMQSISRSGVARFTGSTPASGGNPQMAPDQPVQSFGKVPAMYL
jgi:hypothetical protein